MSKNQNKGVKQAPQQDAPKQKLPQNPNDFGYIGDETITMSAFDLMKLVQGIETALAASIERKFISQPKWISTIDAKEMVQVSAEDVKKGLVKQITSIEKTFDPQGRGNFQETFADWVYPNVTEAKAILQQVHANMVEQGVAKSKEELNAHFRAEQERQAQEAAELAKAREEAKPSMKVVEDLGDNPSKTPESELPPPVPQDVGVDEQLDEAPGPQGPSEDQEASED